jgi:hypothetical protein
LSIFESAGVFKIAFDRDLFCSYIEHEKNDAAAVSNPIFYVEIAFFDKVCPDHPDFCGLRLPNMILLLLQYKFAQYK